MLLISGSKELKNIYSNGSYSVKTFSSSHIIKQVFNHPKFDMKSPNKNDIALVKLTTNIEWGGLNKPTCIKTNDIDSKSVFKTIGLYVSKVLA